MPRPVQAVVDVGLLILGDEHPVLRGGTEWAQCEGVGQVGLAG